MQIAPVRLNKNGRSNVAPCAILGDLGPAHRGRGMEVLCV